MKNSFLSLLKLVVALSLMVFLVSPAFGFTWEEKGFAIKSQEETEDGTRYFLENIALKSFVLVGEDALLTDPVKEKVLALFDQINGTYNLPSLNIEFKIQKDVFRITLILDQTQQIIGITYHGTSPGDNIIPTTSTIINELNAWNNFGLKTLQLVFKKNSFQSVLAPETEFPLVTVIVSESKPQQKLFADLSGLFNEITSWKNFKAKEIALSVSDKGLKAIIDSQDDKQSIYLNSLGSIPTPSSIKKVSRLQNTIGGWKNISVKKADYTIDESSIDLVVAPSRFQSKGKNLLRHIPGGMTFQYDDKINYSFRALSRNYFVRIKDTYSSEQKLERQLNEAIADPILYIQKNDPDYFYRQIEGLRNRNAAVYEEITGKMEQSYNELLEKHQRLETSYNNLRKAHETFIYGVITLENTGFLGSGEVDKNVIEKIIDLKTENPDMTSPQIRKELENQDIDASSKVVHLVLSLYFNDFKE